VVTGDPESRDARFARGAKVLIDINAGSVAGLVNSLADVSPEVAHQIVAWAFGEIYARPALAPRERQLITLAMLAAQGDTEAELRTHIAASLDVGLSPVEIVEVFLQAAVYCGFPRALNATFEAKKAFAERGLLAPVDSSPGGGGDGGDL
jgi:4-carboxymuconolactone decarboxylase